jgi:hypothetical protein
MIDTTGKTLQQVSNEIAGRLIKQGKKCTANDDNSCVYGDGEGNHCGIGWLLDSTSKEVMSFVGNITSLLTDHDHLGINDAFLREHQSILGDIQLLHDMPRDLHARANLDSLNLDAWQPWFDLHS